MLGIEPALPCSHKGMEKNKSVENTWLDHVCKTMAAQLNRWGAQHSLAKPRGPTTKAQRNRKAIEMSHPECKTQSKQHTAAQSDKCIGKLNTYKGTARQKHTCVFLILGRAPPAAKFQCWSNPNRLPCSVVCSRATEPQEQWMALARACWCRLFSSNFAK